MEVAQSLRVKALFECLYTFTLSGLTVEILGEGDTAVSFVLCSEVLVSSVTAEFSEAVLLLLSVPHPTESESRQVAVAIEISDL
jgi:hypothetical protein